MSEHANDFVDHLKQLMRDEHRIVEDESHAPNDDQAWANRDGKFVFTVSNYEFWRNFRITVEAVSGNE